MIENDSRTAKIKSVAQSYYSRKDIQNAIYNFCKNREVVPRYLDFFGKRPDAIDYPSDVISLAKNGATSFHCSEEIWNNPLSIKTDMTPEQYNKIRKGWDLLIDIDSKFFDYAKIAAIVLIETLESHGVKNVGIKYSGSKGFHIMVPFESFPEELYGEKTKNKFPDWPRAIAMYLKEITKTEVNNRIIKLSGIDKLKERGELIVKNYCSDCGNEVVKLEENLFECTNSKCKYKLYFKKNKRKSYKCPSCKFEMILVGTELRYFCNTCKKYKPNIKKQIINEQTTKSQEDSVDIVLVSPRHLFRAPYSLHEKTALSSVVLTKKELYDFEIYMADPLRIKVKNYNTTCKKDEAKKLLIEALDWQKKIEPEKKKFEGKAVDVSEFDIEENMFPDVILKILNKQMSDGKKRALSILLSFFSSIEMPKTYVEDRIKKWNNNHPSPLGESYIKSQIEWFGKNKRMPPNYDKPVYKELGIIFDDNGLKNPVNYTIKKALSKKFNKKDKEINKRNINK